MKFRRLFASLSLITIGFSLGFSSLPAIYVPVSAQTPANRAARLVARERGSQINVRSSPSISAPIKHYGLDGDTVAVLQESKGSDGYSWYFVRFPKSQAIGWVRGDFVVFSNQSSAPNSPIQTLPDVEMSAFGLSLMNEQNLSMHLH
ncbi:SH3 domain-containing protein [Leptolyngbya sp. DQ-M1]|uniref:SH3 domain-containing protein n=1 Tax=Leptolyngbya sp. DQ-M1 TaxID=2933920 RepID=UPI0032969AE8